MAIDTNHQYQQVIEQINQFTPEQQLELMSDLASIIGQRMQKPQEPIKPQHDIMEFEGIAKDLWKDIDVEKYIQEERASWGG
jgi:hypothetical protein